jgi:hypothetical protein
LFFGYFIIIHKPKTILVKKAGGGGTLLGISLYKKQVDSVGGVFKKHDFK